MNRASGGISGSIPDGTGAPGSSGIGTGGLGGQIKSRSESAKSTPSFQVVTEFPFQPIDLIEWVQLRVRALNNKVLIGENGNAFT